MRWQSDHHQLQGGAGSDAFKYSSEPPPKSSQVEEEEELQSAESPDRRFPAGATRSDTIYSNNSKSHIQSSFQLQLNSPHGNPLGFGSFRDSATGGAHMDSNSSSLQHLTAAPSSIGAASTKVSKKRSRASRRPPTTVLEADSSNFRSMVQQLTGIPAPPPIPIGYSSRFDQFLASSGLVRPQATRALNFSFTSAAGGEISSSGQGHSGPGSGAGFFQYQPPYSLRKLESQQVLYSSRPHDHHHHHQQALGFSLDPSKGALNSSGTGTGVYGSQGGGESNAWECGGESLNARVKREDGRPLASSWSTSL